jgi:hypothetical protein
MRRVIPPGDDVQDLILPASPLRCRRLHDDVVHIVRASTPVPQDGPLESRFRQGAPPVARARCSSER